jgi:mono/diheme cytochrome c family protein
MNASSLAGLLVGIFAGGAAVLTPTVPVGAFTPQAAAPAPANALRPVVDKYCVSCHNPRLKTGGLVLDASELNLARDGATWEKVVRKLRTGAMPPAGLPRPDQASSDAAAGYLEQELDRAAAAHPNPGAVGAFHRLSRTEYANAIRDLLSLETLPKELDINTLLPADNSSSGFDNLADLLFVSPTALDSYLSAARKISRVAVGDPNIPVIVDRYPTPQDLPQDVQVEDAPAGTRGGVVIKSTLPVDGEYRVKIEFAGNAREPHQLEVSVDGVRAHVVTVGEHPPTERGNGVFIVPPDKPIEVDLGMKAGPRVITVAYIQHSDAIGEELVRPRRRTRGTQPALSSVTVSGPFTVAGVSDTPSRHRIFVCHPASASEETAVSAKASARSRRSAPDTQASEDGCARQIFSTLARRAYRRASTPEDVQTLMPFYEAGRADGGFERGIQRGLERLLVSPQFLFRIERQPAPGTVARISDLELASRLSFFLWSSIPDDQLLDAAIHGRLKNPAVFDQQVRRMLADRRAESLVTNFAEQWLFLRDVQSKRPDERLYPDFDDSLRSALKREAELFISSIVSEDRSAVDLLTANHTFVNERLARHYGIPYVYGPEFRRVTLTDDYRRGLLGKGAILVLTSYSTRTSPVLRGKYVLANLLGTPPPPPPANVPALKTESPQNGKTLTMREAMVQHRANPVCASCHARMDPIGFALENFDAVGRWRTSGESGTAIDPSGVLPDGSRFDGIVGLRDRLVQHPEPFVTTLTENLLTYAIGRNLEYYDNSVVRSVVHDAARDNYRISSLVLGIVKSTPFQMRRSTVEEQSAAAASRQQ